MGKISAKLLRDYLFVDIAFIAMILLLHPVYFGEYRITDKLLLLMFLQAVLLLVVLVIGELIVSYVLNHPVSYSDNFFSRLHHFAGCAVICLPLMTAMLNQFNVIVKFGTEHWDYAWIYYDGGFTLKWFFKTMPPCIVAAIVTLPIGMTMLTEVRMMRISLRELTAINLLLEQEQENQRTNTPKENALDNLVTLQSDSRDTFSVNPLDIMYVESVGNYLYIVYFNESELRQKRLRSSLKDVEEVLGSYPFIAHIHRAFLVNINFITHVSGNAAGYKLQMFSTDKVLTVSKANVAAFRNKINNIGKGINRGN